MTQPVTSVPCLTPGRLPAVLRPGSVFLANAVLYITLLTLLPQIGAGLGIDKGALGLALLGIPAGTLVALPFAAEITDRLGAARTAAAMLALIAALLQVTTRLPYPGLVAMFVLFGFARAVLEVAQNLLAWQTEQRTGRHVLARSHGFWSLGLLLGTLGGAAAARLSLSAAGQQLGASRLAALIAGPLLARGADALPSAPPRPRAVSLTLPDAPILWVCAALLGASLVEGVTYDWGMFYLGDVLELGERAAHLAFAAFTLGMGAVRLSGDWLRARQGTWRLLLASQASAFAGVALLLAAGAAPALVLATAALALALMGAGMGLIAPLSVVVASGMTNRPLAQNLAALSLANMVSVVAVPALMGHVADGLGLPATFALLLPAIALSAGLILSRRVPGLQPTRAVADP